MKQTRNQYVVIECPSCGKSHHYGIEVRRSPVMYRREQNEDSTPVLPARHFTRLFSCPVTNEDFQADIVLSENLKSIIKSVNVTSALDSDEGIDDE